MRAAELLMAAGLMALSVFFMIYAVALPIGWEEGAGPGGGAFPFWLSLLMLLASCAIFVRELYGAEGIRRAAEQFLHPESRGPILRLAIGVTGAIAITQVAGVYVAIFLFLIFHLWAGRELRAPAILAIAIITPIATFFFFEGALRILLPKGFTEPYFVPLYALIY